MTADITSAGKSFRFVGRQPRKPGWNSWPV